MVKADQEEAARYAEATLPGGHTLSRLLAESCPLRTGHFEWSVEPGIGEPGDWGMKDAPASDLLGMRGWFTRRLAGVVRDDDVVVVEVAHLESDRSWRRNLDEHRELRAVFNDVEAGSERYLVIEPKDLRDGIALASGIADGAHRLVGVVAAVPGAALPPNGADVSDETLREVAEAATHVFFRGPSYDGIVVWTAPARS